MLENELETIKNELCEIEDRSDFGAEFIALARAVYTINAPRSVIKRQISELAGSVLIEEKLYH